MNSGGSGASFGRGLGRSRPSFGHLWAHFGRFLDVPNHIFSKHWSKMSSKKPFKEIWARFWKVLGRFWEGLGRNLEGFGAFWTGNGQILEMLAIIWPCFGRVSK